MRINKKDLYHGAALIQVAQDPQFTAINLLKVGGESVQAAYKINDEVALYLKYGTEPTKAHGEYKFSFNQEHLLQLHRIAKANPKTFISLVCLRDKEVCCLSMDQLESLIAARRKAAGAEEPQYQVLVTVPKGKGLRVYVNVPNRRNVILDEELVVSRSAFPGVIFE